MSHPNQAYWDFLSDEMYPTWFLHSFVMNGKISGHVAALGDMQGDILCVADAPVGCGFHYRNSARRRQTPYYSLLCSDMKENDIVMGGEAKLEQTIREAYAKYKPALVYIVPSPVTDILNEDIFSVADRLRADGIPAVAGKSERFSLPDKDYVRCLTRERSKQKVGGDNHLEIDVSGCGFNEAICAIIDSGMENVPKVKRSVNIETISWGLEGAKKLDEVEEFLNRCGITVNCRIPNSSVEAVRNAPAAELNLVSHFIKWARRMKSKYGTDYLHMGESMRYDGLDGICTFYRDIGTHLGISEEMEPLIEDEYKKALTETKDERAVLSSKNCILACGSLIEAPKKLNMYAKLFGIKISAVCITWTDDMRRYYYVDDELNEMLMSRLKDAVSLYSPWTEIVFNPSKEKLREMSSRYDAIVGTNDFTFDGNGIPVIPAIQNTMSFSFPSYVRSVRRMAESFSRIKENRSLVLNRMGLSSEDPNLYPDRSHKASREMWFRLWWDYNDGKKKGCCE